MNTQPNLTKAGFRNLEQRLAGRPQVLARFHSIADMMDRAMAEGCSAAQAEELAIRQPRLKLAGCWWKETHAQAMLNVRVARANNPWNSYWAKVNGTLNLTPPPVAAGCWGGVRVSHRAGHEFSLPFFLTVW